MPIDIHVIEIVLRKEEIIAKKLNGFFESILWGRNCRGPDLGILEKRVHTDQVKGSTAPEPDSTHQGTLTELNDEIPNLST